MWGREESSDKGGEEVCRVPAGRTVRILAICVYLQTLKIIHFLALTLKFPSVFGPHIVTLSLSTLTSGLLLST